LASADWTKNELKDDFNSDGKVIHHSGLLMLVVWKKKKGEGCAGDISSIRKVNKHHRKITSYSFLAMEF
jgi:hypothetical protein